MAYVGPWGDQGGEEQEEDGAGGGGAAVAVPGWGAKDGEGHRAMPRRRRGWSYVVPQGVCGAQSSHSSTAITSRRRGSKRQTVRDTPTHGTHARRRCFVVRPVKSLRTPQPASQPASPPSVTPSRRSSTCTPPPPSHRAWPRQFGERCGPMFRPVLARAWFSQGSIVAPRCVLV